MLTNSRDIIRRLLKEGWEEARVSGSHHQFRKPGVPCVLTVPHPKKDLKPGLVLAIYKLAGWPRD